jgi:hypothetical protein
MFGSFSRAYGRQSTTVYSGRWTALLGNQIGAPIDLPKLWTLIRADLAKAQNTLSANAASHKALAEYQEFLDHNELELACDMLAQIALLLATMQFDTQAVAAADSPKDLTVAASSSLRSKTVSFPSCITARTFFVGLSSFNSPRRFRTLVKEPIR